MKNFKLNPFLGLSALALTLSACGPQAYVPGTVQSNQNAAGSMYIPPKVDIILGVSQDGTMSNIYPAIQQGIYNLTTTLKAKNWDYRFVAISLSEYQANDNLNLNSKVSTSYYDGVYNNFGSWIPPFPGASPTNPFTTLLLSLFAQQFTFPNLDTVPSHNNAHEWGFKNQLTFIQQSNVQQNFMRPDAQLAFITISTGDDHSTNTLSDVTCTDYSAITDPYGIWRKRTDGTNCLSDADYYPNTSKVGTFKGQVGLVKSPGLVKYYSVIAMPSNNATTCGGNAIRRGYYYQQAATDLGGKTIDLCSTGIDTAMAQIGADLNTNQAIYRKHYLVLSTQPTLSSIVVKKVSGGVAQTVPQDSTNGWTYHGYDTVVPVDQFKLQNDPNWYPYNGASETGYIIELHGSAILTGDDTATVQYMNSGGQVVAQ